MRHAALAISVLVLTGVVLAEDDQAESRVAALEKENLALKRRVVELANRINEMYAEKAGVTYTDRITIPSDGELNPKHLRGIELAEKPSRHDVRLYVARILRAAVPAAERFSVSIAKFGDHLDHSERLEVEASLGRT